MDETTRKVLDYFKKYSSVGVLRALEDLYTLYKIEPGVGMRTINELIKMGILEREGDIFSGTLNYTVKHGKRLSESDFVSEFEAAAVESAIKLLEGKVIDWRSKGVEDECH
ncbi:MAG: hypothetical protein DRI22_00440 [Caldiserica bacterium]|nr:MAG: hypothetical protein DRI22_00440 [Caldisericota bacterium]